jgi:hypothetical protein
MMDIGAWTSWNTSPNYTFSLTPGATMSTSRLYVSLVIAIVVCVLLSAGAAWGVSSLVLTGNVTHTAAGATGANGKDGANGKNGTAGKDGANGATGATGATGAKGAPGPADGPKGDTGAAGTNGTDGTNGTNGINGINGTDGTPGTPGAPGIQGLQGIQGIQGEKGDTGASAPTFSTTPPDGVFFLSPDTIRTVATLVGPIPSGPTLVGYSFQLTTDLISSSVTCQLVNATTLDVIAQGSSEVVAVGATTLFAQTEVTSLPTASSLRVECTTSSDFIPNYSYSNVSMYAISFASS